MTDEEKELDNKENNIRNVRKEHDDGKLFAFASVVLGVVAIGCMLISCAIGPLFAIAGIVMSYMAKKRGCKDNMRQIGFVLSLIALGLMVIFIIEMIKIYNMDIASGAIMFIR